jgi:hypothetical protein
MKATINGKRYNSEKCEVLGEKDYYSNGNLIGTSTLLRASNGVLLEMYDSRDRYQADSLRLFSESSMTVDNFNYTDEQEKRMIELKLIEEV